VIGLLAVSSLLNASYFLPIVYRGWIKPPTGKVAEAKLGGLEIGWPLLAPPLFTSALVLLAGILAASKFSPLAWATIIAERQFGY